ncbi:MAG TPA: beta-propeller fold lactonase family protein, partial [Blastocatellia bacterium]|nr:beta-propeller fold lactonase family protein [Blastocatellia bacterium]
MSILSAGLVALMALVMPLPGRGQMVVGTITRPGLVPRAVAVYEGGNRVFVADNSTGNVYIYDGATNAELGSIAAGAFVQDMLVNEATGKLYIASAGASKLFVVNAATGAHITDFTGVFVGTQIAQDAGLGKVYATFGGLQQIDVVTNARTSVGGILGVDMAVNTATHEVFITSGVNNTLQIVNGMTLGVTTINNLGGEGIAVNPVNNKAYITFCENDAMGRPHPCIYNRNTNMSSLVTDANDAVEAFYSAAGNRVYTSSEVNGHSTIIDGATDASFNLPMPGATISLGFRNATKRVYYAALKLIGVLDEETQTLERIPINNPFADMGGIIISDVAVNQTTGRVYVINDSRLDFVTVVQDGEKLTRPPVYMGSRSFPSRILVMDPTSKTTVEVRSVPDAFQSNETMTVRPGGGRLYVPRSSPFGNELQVYAGAGMNTFLRSFTTGGNGPVTAAFTPDGARAYVTNSASNNVGVINVANDSVITSVMTGSTPFGAVVTPDGSRVYVANRGSGTVTVINTASNTVATTITVGSNPWGVAVNPAGTKVYVANSGSGSVSVINTATNTVIATVPVGMTPHYLAVSPDGKNVYVGNRGSATVSVISTGTDAVIDTVTVGAN